MLIANISQFRKDLKSYIDRVTDDRDTLIVNGNGKTVVVMLLEDYNGMDATDYLTSNPVNKSELDLSIQQLNEDRIVSKTFEELEMPTTQENLKKMNIVFSAKAWEQYQYWQETDEKILQRINMLIKEYQRTPFKGMGKPEPLKDDYKGFWSRRIDQEHRLIYTVANNALEIVQCRFYY